MSEIGDAENISKSYVSRILRLALLAPDIIEAAIEGRSDYALTLQSLERPLPASWDEQRAALRVGAMLALAHHGASPSTTSVRRSIEEQRLPSKEGT